MAKENPKFENPKFKIWWDEENKIVRYWVKGIGNKKLAEDVVVETQTLLTAHPEAKGVLVDVSEVILANRMARQVFAKGINSIKKPFAFYGTNLVTRVIVKLIFRVTGRSGNMKIFATEEEALEWLKQ